MSHALDGWRAEIERAKEELVELSRDVLASTERLPL